MNYIYIIVIKILVFTVAIAAGYLLFNNFVDPYILQPLCISNTHKCIRIGYWHYGNSALLHMEPEGYWAWFNGEKAYVYGAVETGTASCVAKGVDGEYEPAFEIDIVQGNVLSYECVTSLPDIQKFYNDKGVTKRSVFKRVQLMYTNGIVRKFDVIDALNILHDENIINLKK